MKNRICFLLAILLSSLPLEAQRVIDLPDLLNPHLIRVNSQRMFIVQETTVFIYSLKDFQLIKKFGRAGEGPGEFKSFISDVEVGRDWILINSSGRLSWFDKNGQFKKQRNDKALGHNYRVLEDGFVGMRMIREKDGIFFAINVFNSEFVALREIYRYRHPFFNRRRRINAVDLRISSYCVYGDKIFLDNRDGVIQIFDRKGENLYAVAPKIIPVELTPEMRNKYLDFWKSDLKAEYEVLNDRLYFPAFFPLIKDFQVTDGKIYLLTHREMAGRNELFVLDLSGKLITKNWVELADVNMLLPHLFNYYTIQGNRIYKLVDNPDREIWELHIFELDK